MELLPCPFCGGKATFDHDDNGWYWIVCEKCGTATNSRTHTMEDCHPLLAEKWNRRASPTGAPKGFALVPVVPTHAILDVMFNAGIDRHDGDLTILYRAMLAAAPTPPVSEDKDKIIAAANALENIASTSSSTRIRRVANEALKATRARRKA